MKIDKNSEDIIAIIKKYYTLPPDARTYAGSLLRKYDQLRFEQYKFEKAKRNPESLKEWIASFLTDIKDSENVEKLRKVKLKTEKKEGKPEEKTDEVKPTKIEELLETEIERMNRREVPQSIRPELKQYLVENGFSADKIDEMIPKEAWQEAIRIYKGEATKQQGENPAERIPEILSDLDEEEPEGRLKKGKRKETSKRERRKEQRKAGEE